MNTNNLTPAAKEAIISNVNRMKSDLRNLIGDMMISNVKGWEMDLAREAAQEFDAAYTDLMATGNYEKAGLCYSCVTAALNVADQIGAKFATIEGAWKRLARTHMAFFQIELKHNLNTFA